MKSITIRQPGYLPYIGFFKKIQSSDEFVYLDDVQYERGDWDNRNRIRTRTGITWLTVPVYNKFQQNLNQVIITNKENWSKKHIKTIEINYQNAPYFSTYWDSIKLILNKFWEKLIDLNLALIELFNDILEIKTKTIRSSELNIKSNGSERLLDICKQLNATTYVSGELGKNYLNEEIFRNAGIEVKYENFQYPIYKQIHGKDFIPNLSIIDLLFNEGINSKEILQSTKNL